MRIVSAAPRLEHVLHVAEDRLLEPHPVDARGGEDLRLVAARRERREDDRLAPGAHHRLELLRLDDLLAQCQSQAGSPPHFLGRKKGVKNLADHRLGDADPGIFNEYLCGIIQHNCRHNNFSAGNRKFNRIRNKVGQHLTNEITISISRRQRANRNLDLALFNLQ